MRDRKLTGPNRNVNLHLERQRKENMKVGIFGSGDVAKSFARMAFPQEGHEVMLGSRGTRKADLVGAGKRSEQFIKR